MRVRGMMGGRGGYNTGHALGRTLCPAEIDVVCETGVAEVLLLRKAYQCALAHGFFICWFGSV